MNRKDWEPSEYSWLCSGHFVGGQKSNDPTSPAYNPTIFEHVKSPKKRKAEADLQRFSRAKVNKRRKVEILHRDAMIAEEKERERLEAEERARIQKEAEQYNEQIELEQRHEASEALIQLSRVQQEIQFSQASTQTEAPLEDINELEKSRKDLLMQVDSLKRENSELTKQIAVVKQALITPEALMEDDSKVKYFTGLPSYKILKAVFDFVSPCFKTYSRTAMPLFNQFLMVLI